MAPHLENRKTKGKSLILIAMTLMTSGCHDNDLPTRKIRVSEVSDPDIDALASAQEHAAYDCKEWTLTPRSAALFFSLNEPISDRDYHHEFDRAPCKITGALTSDGEPWTFEINGATKSVWTRGEETRFFGCKREECRPLVIWEYLSPDLE